MSSKFIRSVKNKLV